MKKEEEEASAAYGLEVKEKRNEGYGWAEFKMRDGGGNVQNAPF